MKNQNLFQIYFIAYLRNLLAQPGWVDREVGDI